MSGGPVSLRHSQVQSLQSAIFSSSLGFVAMMVQGADALYVCPDQDMPWGYTPYRYVAR